MKKMLVALLFVVGMVLSAAAYTIAIALPCDQVVMTDSDAFETKKEMDDFRKIMTEIHCK